MMPRAAFAMVLAALGGCTPFDRPYEIKYPSSESESRYAPVQQYGPYVTPRPFGARPPAAAADASNGQTPYPVVARISAPATLAAAAPRSGPAPLINGKSMISSGDLDRPWPGGAGIGERVSVKLISSTVSEGRSGTGVERVAARIVGLGEAESPHPDHSPQGGREAVRQAGKEAEKSTRQVECEKAQAQGKTSALLATATPHPDLPPQGGKGAEIARRGERELENAPRQMGRDLERSAGQVECEKAQAQGKTSALLATATPHPNPAPQGGREAEAALHVECQNGPARGKSVACQKPDILPPPRWPEDVAIAQLTRTPTLVLERGNKDGNPDPRAPRSAQATNSETRLLVCQDGTADSRPHVVLDAPQATGGQTSMDGSGSRGAHVALENPQGLTFEPSKTTANKPTDMWLGDGQELEAAPACGVRFVGSKRIRLDYQVQGVGSSGISDVELWCTRDGRTWQKHSAARQARPPYIADLDDEDLYGLTLLVHSGVGLGPKPPQEGDRPQVWVEVDTTRPTVRLLGTQAVQSADGRCLIVLWKASDKNLAAQPITISFATDADGPWTPIAARIQNSGRYVWPMPPGMPHRLFLRIEATDMAGNVGVIQTTSPLVDDPAQPTTSIVAVEASK